MLNTPLVAFPMFSYLSILLAGLCFIKVVYFVRYKNSSWRLSHLLHFAEDDIMNSSSWERQSAKRAQNFLSQIILSLAILNVIVAVLTFWM